MVKPGFEVMAASGHDGLPFSYDRPLELIEAAGRVCYKSEDKAWTVCPECGGAGSKTYDRFFCNQHRKGMIPQLDRDEVFNCPICDGGKWETSAEKFVDMLERRGHHAMLEHSWASGLDIDCVFEGDYPSPFLRQGRPAFWTLDTDPPLIAGNLRAFADYHGCQVSELFPVDAWLEPITATYRLDAKHAWLCAMTVRIVCDRGVTHEIVRHRPASYAQESTRYCNYGGGVTFVIPPWVEGIEPGEYGPKGSLWETDDGEINGHPRLDWAWSCLEAEGTYSRLLGEGWRPEQARSVLPNSLKTEIVVTASLEEWRHIFKLRCAQAAHPQMREIMLPLRDEARRLFPGVFGEGA